MQDVEKNSIECREETSEDTHRSGGPKPAEEPSRRHGRRKEGGRLIGTREKTEVR